MHTFFKENYAEILPAYYTCKVIITYLQIIYNVLHYSQYNIIGTHFQNLIFISSPQHMLAVYFAITNRIDLNVID